MKFTITLYSYILTGIYTNIHIYIYDMVIYSIPCKSVLDSVADLVPFLPRRGLDKSVTPKIKGTFSEKSVVFLNAYQLIPNGMYHMISARTKKIFMNQKVQMNIV